VASLPAGIFPWAEWAVYGGLLHLHGGHYNFCTGSYYNALFMGLRGCRTSFLIGFSDTSLFFSFMALCFIHVVPFSWFLVGTVFSLNFTLPLAPWPG